MNSDLTRDNDTADLTGKSDGSITYIMWSVMITVCVCNHCQANKVILVPKHRSCNCKYTFNYCQQNKGPFICCCDDKTKILKDSDTDHRSCIWDSIHNTQCLSKQYKTHFNLRCCANNVNLYICLCNDICIHASLF